MTGMNLALSRAARIAASRYSMDCSATRAACWASAVYAWMTAMPWRLFSSTLLMAPTACRVRRYWGWTLVAKKRTATTAKGRGTKSRAASRQSSHSRNP